MLPGSSPHSLISRARILISTLALLSRHNTAAPLSTKRPPALAPAHINAADCCVSALRTPASSLGLPRLPQRFTPVSATTASSSSDLPTDSYTAGTVACEIWSELTHSSSSLLFSSRALWGSRTLVQIRGGRPMHHTVFFSPFSRRTTTLVHCAPVLFYAAHSTGAFTHSRALLSPLRRYPQRPVSQGSSNISSPVCQDSNHSARSPFYHRDMAFSARTITSSKAPMEISGSVAGMLRNAKATSANKKGKKVPLAAAPAGAARGGDVLLRKAARAPAKKTGAPRGRPRKVVTATTAAELSTTIVAPAVSVRSRGTRRTNTAATAERALTSTDLPHPFATTEEIVPDSENSNGADSAEEAEMMSGQYELEHEELCGLTSARLRLPLPSVRFVLTQAKAGATVPFLARYRQGETGRLDETQLRLILDTAKEIREVHRRRQFMLRSLEARGLLTPALSAVLADMTHVSQLEDAWEPYKERRTSLASRGRAEGLGDYAFALLHFSPDEERSMAQLSQLRAAVEKVEDGQRLLTAVLAEDLQRVDSVRQRLGAYVRSTARLSSTMLSKPRRKAAKELSEDNFDQLRQHFSFYKDRSWTVDRIAAHTVLALHRGEAKGVLRVETTSGPESRAVFRRTVEEVFPGTADLLQPSGTASRDSAGAMARRSFKDYTYCRGLLETGLHAAYEYLLKQAHTTIRRDLRKSAEQEAILVFAHNLEHLLLQRPMSHARILAMDPGHTHGVKCVLLDEHGAVENSFTCTLMDEAKMCTAVAAAVEEHRVNKIVIGNGTASTETAELVAHLIKQRRWTTVEFAVVSEAGASVYSVSDIAKEEFPTLSVMYRGAVNIGRRVLDPLSELVKIPVRSMGIGMYQHDVTEKELLRELGYVVESCVAKVGVNAVSANRYVMEKVPGIQKRIVDQIVLARHARRLHSREDLRVVPAMTESVYEQVAGFFRFPNSPEPLDNTNIHPESYALVRQLARLHRTGQLAKHAGAELAEMPAAVLSSASKDPDAAVLADADSRHAMARLLHSLSASQRQHFARRELHCSVETLELVASELAQPGLDPRASLPHAGLLRREVRDVRKLRAGDRLSGMVQSVTMFGAFVDCGLHANVLVRGPGVDRLRVGSYLDQRVRFESLDHLQRPQMTLLPDPAEAPTAARGGAARRLRLEADDRSSGVSQERQGNTGSDDESLNAGKNDGEGDRSSEQDWAPTGGGGGNVASAHITPSATRATYSSFRSSSSSSTGNSLTAHVRRERQRRQQLRPAYSLSTGEEKMNLVGESRRITTTASARKRQRSPSSDMDAREERSQGGPPPQSPVTRQPAPPAAPQARLRPPVQTPAPTPTSATPAVATAAVSPRTDAPRTAFRWSSSASPALSTAYKAPSAAKASPPPSPVVMRKTEEVDVDALSSSSSSSASGEDVFFSF